MWPSVAVARGHFGGGTFGDGGGGGGVSDGGGGIPGDGGGDRVDRITVPRSMAGLPPKRSDHSRRSGPGFAAQRSCTQQVRHGAPAVCMIAARRNQDLTDENGRISSAANPPSNAAP